MITRDYDITGFVNFPNLYSKNIKPIDTGKTFIYLAAIDFNSEEFSKQKISINGNYCGDDVSPKKQLNTSKLSIDQIISEMKSEKVPEINIENPVVSLILIGWSKFSYQYNTDIQTWICTFRELTNEGKKIYYSIKKLHYDKEVRILTFNNIK